MSVFQVPQPTLAIAGTDERFTVRRIYCVGRNYADHAREMGADPDREPPFFFSKPSDAAFTASEGCEGGAAFVVPYPPQTAQLEHEVELAVALGPAPHGAAGVAVWGYAVSVDLTRRDLQAVAKELRRPWDLSKGFDASAPASPLVPVSQVGELASGAIELSVDGVSRQRGDLSDQIWSVPELIAELAQSVALRPGDLILTGTPAGVGPVERGSRVRASIERVGSLEFTIA